MTLIRYIDVYNILKLELFNSQILFLIKNPKLLVSIILIILLILSIYFLINYKIKSVDYKIYYFKLNMLLLLLYILFFFFAIIYLRYIRFGFIFDLKLFYTKIFDLIQSIHLFYTIIMFLLLINFILLFNLFKVILIKALIKRYIYYYFKVIYRYVLVNPEIKSLNLLENHIFTRIIDMDYKTKYLFSFQVHQAQFQ